MWLFFLATTFFMFMRDVVGAFFYLLRHSEEKNLSKGIYERANNRSSKEYTKSPPSHVEVSLTWLQKNLLFKNCNRRWKRAISG